jgi:hypothetical protein
VPGAILASRRFERLRRHGPSYGDVGRDP